MTLPFAEVIGNPVAQSKSPVIHQRWLNRLAIAAEFRATRVSVDDLPRFIEHRRRDADWRGCSVTIPHKQMIMEWLTHVDPAARLIGAVNCVVPRRGRLMGSNTDVAGVAASLDGIKLNGASIAVIGAGGAARAVLAYLHTRDVRQVTILAREPGKAEPLRSLVPRARLDVLPLDRCDEAFQAETIINASPLGMTGAPEMSAWLVNSLARHASGRILFDLVTTPAETAFLAAGRAQGATVIDGKTMLIAQAREAFRLFFDVAPPASDRALHELLAG